MESHPNKFGSFSVQFGQSVYKGLFRRSHFYYVICVQSPNFRLVGNTGLLPLPDNALLETTQDLHHGEINRGGGDLQHTDFVIFYQSWAQNRYFVNSYL